MSASLVGSEMCIRDRHPSKTTAVPPCGWRGSACLDRRLTFYSKRKTAPVSYTHLTLPTICSV
eukprot:11486512-Alexandrium_andersonii.AAC.1